MAVIEGFAGLTRRGRFSILRFVSQMIAVRRQRVALAQAPDHLLKDMGLTREDALAEADRPVWDVPANWLERRDYF